jgi:hypothetical protein
LESGHCGAAQVCAKLNYRISLHRGSSDFGSLVQSRALEVNSRAKYRWRGVGDWTGAARSARDSSAILRALVRLGLRDWPGNRKYLARGGLLRFDYWSRFSDARCRSMFNTQDDGKAVDNSLEGRQTGNGSAELLPPILIATMSRKESKSFEDAGQQKQAGLVSEFFYFLMHNKKFWLIPLLLALLGMGILILLGGTAAAPFIYTLF